jgi:hypothetical protein
MRCHVASVDARWVRSVLAEIDAVPATTASQQCPEDFLTIDVVLDDSLKSWASLLQANVTAGSDNMARVLVLLVTSFPTVSTGQIWLRNGSSDRLMNFVNFPENAYDARACLAMFCQVLGVDPLSIEEVILTHETLGRAPKLGKKMIVRNFSSPRIIRRPLPFDVGFVESWSDGGPSSDIVRDSDTMPAVAEAIGFHRNECTAGAIIGTPSSNVSSATYVLTAGHPCAHVDAAFCLSGVENSLMKVQHVDHCDPVTFDVERTAFIVMPERRGVVLRAVADISVFSFICDVGIVRTHTKQPQERSPVDFPSGVCWGRDTQVHGYGRHVGRAAAGERYYTCSGWVSVPTDRDPDVRHCLYLARPNTAQLFVGGNSGTSLSMCADDALHSFVCQTVHISRLQDGALFVLQGLTPAVIALHQARELVGNQSLQYVAALPSMAAELPAPTAVPAVAEGAKARTCGNCNIA